MSFSEPYLAPFSTYSNQNKGTPMSAQEEWLDRFPHKRAENKPNGGIIRRSAPVIFVGGTHGKISKAEHKKRIAQAQRENKEALKNLTQQEERDAKAIAKQLKKWKEESNKEEQECAREEARIKRNAAKRAERAAAKAKRLKKEMTTKAGQEVLNTLKEHGIYQVSDFELSRKYLKNIIGEIQSLGYTVNRIMKSRFIVAYRMDKQ